MHPFIEKFQGAQHRIAVVDRGATYTYQALNQEIEKQYHWLSGRVPEGAVVALCMDYSFSAISLFLAMMENKNVIIPIATTVPEEIESRLSEVPCAYRLIQDPGGTLRLLSETERHDSPVLLQKLQERGHAGLVLFSSGSTGKPKAMVHDLTQLIAHYEGKRERKRNMTFLIFLMFDHIGGINTLLNSLAMHITMVLPERREPEYIASLVERYHVAVLPSSPTFLNLLLLSGAAEKYDLSSLRMITYGTEPMPSSLLMKLKAAFPHVRFLQTFGTSETGIISTVSKSSTSTFLKFDDPDTEYKVVDGELWLRTKTQVMGYLNAKAERFTEDGWFRTGDFVEEKDGFLRIVGRNSDMINVGGEKVMPEEVEAVLLQMPGVEDVTVYGESNPITGQAVACKIKHRDAAVTPLEIKKEVRKFCKTRLASYKIPVRVVLMEQVEYTKRFKKKR